MTTIDEFDFRHVEGTTAYLVNALGHVKRAPDRALKLQVVNGYFTFAASEERVRATKYVHRCVAECFVEKPADWTPAMLVKHRDGDRSNNRWTNLEWVTKTEVGQRAARTKKANLAAHVRS